MKPLSNHYLQSRIFGRHLHSQVPSNPLGKVRCFHLHLPLGHGSLVPAGFAKACTCGGLFFPIKADLLQDFYVLLLHQSSVGTCAGLPVLKMVPCRHLSTQTYPELQLQVPVSPLKFKQLLQLLSGTTGLSSGSTHRCQEFLTYAIETEYPLRLVFFQIRLGNC